MATPLDRTQHQLDPRTFALKHLATQMDHQGFNVSKHYRRARWRAVDRFKGFPVPVFHAVDAIKKR
ncbi:hypothetical protein ACLEJQ_01365 [Pseudomonas sp. SMV71]|uniref:hypothetical protein n=1 Tax=Pseudomonas sp. SMV71 TaxID=3390195 RepID=UPI003F85F5E9